MSRDITTAFRIAVTSALTRPVLLMNFFFDTETLRFWNGVGDFIHDSDTYTGAGHLIKISDIDETQQVQAKGITATLSGIPTSLVAIALAEEYQGRKVEIKLAFLNEDNTVIADPFKFFNGKADVMSITDGAETATISLTAESDIAALLRVNERRRTSEDQKLKYANDTFFDNVTALQSKEILWGGS